MSISFKFEFKFYVNRGINKNQKDEGVLLPDSFLQLAEQEVERLKSSLSPSTIENYKTFLRSIQLYMQENIIVSDVNEQFVKGYERWLRNRNLCLNTVSCYMRSFRSLLNRINGENHTRVFKGVYTGRSKTEKRAVSEPDIIRIKQARLRPSSFLNLTRDIFLFSYYALGMPFVDIAFLRHSQICGNHLVYQRHKTGQRIVVPLESCMFEIINRYRSDRDYVFPLIKSNDPSIAYHEYLIMLNRYNRSLKTLARKSGLNLRITSYTARHTWASVAYSSNVCLPIISKALGHTNPQTTLTYIKEINDKCLEEANREIISRI